MPGDKYSTHRPVFLGAVDLASPSQLAVEQPPFAIGMDLVMVGDIRVFSVDDIAIGLTEADNQPEQVEKIVLVMATRCKPEVAIFNPVTGWFSSGDPVFLGRIAKVDGELVAAKALVQQVVTT